MQINLIVLKAKTYVNEEGKQESNQSKQSTE